MKASKSRPLSYGVVMLAVMLAGATLLESGPKVAAPQSVRPTGIKNVVLVHGA